MNDQYDYPIQFSCFTLEKHSSLFILYKDSIITDYLKSDSFQSVIPEGLALTNITTDQEDPNSGSAFTSGYCVLVLVATFASVLTLFWKIDAFADSCIDCQYLIF